MSQVLEDAGGEFQVVIVDSRFASRAGLRLVLETEPGVRVVGEAGTLAEGLQYAAKHEPHVLILDLDLAGADAVATTRQLTTRFPTCSLILIALLLNPATHSGLLSAGAAACIEKDLPEKFLRIFRELRQRLSFSA